MVRPDDDIPSRSRAAIERLDLVACIIDRDGVIRVVSRGWEWVAARGGGDGDAYRGWNYLDVCARAGVDDIGAGLRAVADGQRGVFEADYEMPLMGQPRLFLLRAAMVEGGAIILHLDSGVT